MKKFLYELSKKIILIITRERNVPIVLFSSLILFIFLIFSCDLFFPKAKDSSLFIKAKSKSDETEQNHLRHLDNTITNLINNISIPSSDFIYLDTNNTNITNKSEEDPDFIILKIKRLKMNMTEKVLFYEFVKSITTGFYYGEWDNFQIKKSKLRSKLYT